MYHANGGTGDPNDLQTTPSANVTLSGEEPSRDGYTFVEWNTDSQGNGDDYSPSGAYVMPGDGETDHLYAQWQVVPATTTTTSTSTTTTSTTTTTTVAPESTTTSTAPEATTTTSQVPLATTTIAPAETTTTTASTSTSTAISEVSSTLAATEADGDTSIQLPSTGASSFNSSIPILIGVVGLLVIVATRRRVH